MLPLEQDFCTVDVKELNVGFMQEHIIGQGYEIVSVVPAQFVTKGEKMKLEKVMIFLRQKAVKRGIKAPSSRPRPARPTGSEGHTRKRGE